MRHRLSTVFVALDSFSKCSLEFFINKIGKQGWVNFMDKRKADLFRKKLLAKQEELLRLVTKSNQDGREADEEATQDVADKAANSYTKEFLFHQSDDNRRVLQLVNEALERIKTSSYGLCAARQEEVEPKRLDAVPWARHCIECQTKQEQGQL